MGQKLVAYDANGIVVGFYDSIDSPAPPDISIISITDAQWHSCINNPGGWTVANGSLVEPASPSPSETAAQALMQSARVALAAGLKITSTGTSAINGTYAVDQLSQSDIIAIETSLNAGKGFPGGSASFGYPDAAGLPHTFNATNFTNFAAAVRDFVYGCRAVIAGASETLPANTITIA